LKGWLILNKKPEKIKVKGESGNNLTKRILYINIYFFYQAIINLKA